MLSPQVSGYLDERVFEVHLVGVGHAWKATQRECTVPANATKHVRPAQSLDDRGHVVDGACNSQCEGKAVSAVMRF